MRTVQATLVAAIAAAILVISPSRISAEESSKLVLTISMLLASPLMGHKHPAEPRSP